MRLRGPAFCLTFALAAPAFADDPLPPSSARSTDVCVQAADRGQLSRDRRRFIAARQDLLVCSAPECPLAIRRDCARWLENLEKRMPGVVVSVRDEHDHDLVDVRVLVDGKVITDRLDGRLSTVDPGEHVFRYEPRGRPAVEDRVLVREGETNRLLTVKLRPLASAGLSERDERDERAARSPVPSRPVPATSVALAGLGAIGIGGFAFFAATASSDIHELRDTCGRTHSCAASDVDQARRELVIANVALGVGVVALAGAAVLYLTRAEYR